MPRESDVKIATRQVSTTTPDGKINIFLAIDIPKNGNNNLSVSVQFHRETLCGDGNRNSRLTGFFSVLDSERRQKCSQTTTRGCDEVEDQV